MDLEKTDKFSKFSVVVSKKVAKTAVKRNLQRRRANEALRAVLVNRKHLIGNKVTNVIIFVKKNIEGKNFKDLQSELGFLMSSILR